MIILVNFGILKKLKMKKIALIAFALSIFAVSCKKEEKVDTPAEETVAESGLKIISDSTKVNWVAYKTTDKVTVKGSFTEINLQDTKAGETPQEVLEGARFSIPVSSVFSNDPIRDGKLKEFFFMVMKDPEFIGGEFHTKNGSSYLMLTINSITKEIPLNIEYVNNKFTISGNLNLEDFSAQDAISSLNKVCFDLHKGPDGVSKTWSEVAISGSVVFE